jgi:NADPH:quinone reductase-like Zn-dependent oxidoreductase
MKAIVYHGGGSRSTIKLEDIAKPIPADDEVLIKVRAASVNPIDAGAMKHPFMRRVLSALSKRKSTGPGRDVAGRVEAVGRNVTQFKPGDAVFGLCGGAFTEYACAVQSALVMKPANASFEQAAAVPLAGLTALQGLRNKGKIQSGQKVLIKEPREVWERSRCKLPSRSARKLQACAARGTLPWSRPLAPITSLITPERISQKVVSNTT